MMRDSFKSAINIKIASKIDQAGEQQTVNQAVQGDLLLNEDHSYTILYKMENHLIRLEVAQKKPELSILVMAVERYLYMMKKSTWLNQNTPLIREL